MAQKRMFDKSITESDAFRSMPLSSQALYFHLGMVADDEGVVNNPISMKRSVGASDDDLNILIGKNFVIPFDSGILVIKHWRVNNYIAKDRFKPSTYREELSRLSLKENGSYTTCIQNVYDPVYSLDTQNRTEQNRLDKNNNKQTNKSNLSSKAIKVTSIVEKMTPHEWENIRATFQDPLGLIDYIDSSCDIASVAHAYQFVLKVATNQKWPTTE